MTDLQIVIVLLALPIGSTIIMFAVGSAGRELPARHARRGISQQPPTLETDPIPLKDRVTISLPRPRRYVPEVPPLTIDSTPDLPVERSGWACSLCRDGELASPSRSGICAWCMYESGGRHDR